ncbi:ataxin-2 homolog [Euwallacea similis]|uniref:ataxin-2 homolog n=1 Tax=Euwallacea similis TaxID=1736056 RepID=UPI00344B4168
MNKRKTRGGSVRGQRQRSLGTEGVYSNPTFMHAATSQVGNVARITTASGQVWEGVFRTFSQNFDVVLEVVAKVENPDAPDSRLLTETHRDKLIFKPCDILNMTFKNVDLDFPVKDTFQTDTAISARLNGNRNEEKELEPWDAGQLNGNDLNLDLEASNGWDVQDMFRKNEQEYGVQSTFDHSLRGYTVPLQASDSADFKEAQAKAEQIASEIENQPGHRARLELENGDEEAAFAAVVRPNQQQESNGKYIPPAKRKGQNNGKLVRSTPPPSGGSSAQNSPSPKETRAPIQYPPHSGAHQGHQNNIHPISPNAHTPPQQPHPPQGPQPVQHMPPPPHVHAAVPPQVLTPQVQNIPPPIHAQPMPMPQHVPLPNNPPPRPNSHTPPHQYTQGPSPRPGGPHAVPHTGPPHGKPQMNGEIKSGPQQRQQRHQQQYHPDRIMHAGPPGHPQGPPPQQVAYQEVKQEQGPPHSIPAPQQVPRSQPPPPQPVQNQETLKELHAFSQDFTLASMPAHTSPTLQPVPPPHVQQGLANQSLSHIQGTESPQMVTQMAPPVQTHSAGTSPSGSSSNLSAHSSIQEQLQTSISSQKQPSPAQSPQSIESEKLQSAVAKSKLNPNAKEFVLNPTAKPFQPRSPSTPSASRPHTPQTPSHSPYIAVSGPGGGPPMPVTMMPMHYMAISQPQYQPPPPPQSSRMRKIPMGQIRNDMASQMQHAAAVTGQPLLAPAPLPQFIYPSAAAAAHSMNQAAAYQPTVAAMHAAAAATIRMYDSAAAASAAQAQLPYLPPQPSGTPSPAQSYNPAAVQQQQGPPQGYQAVQHTQQAPPQVGMQNIGMFCIPAQPHLMPNVPYLQQAPPPGPPQHLQVLVQHQHPSQGGNHHGQNP